MTKNLYKGSFNVSGQPITLHTRSVSKDRAYDNFIIQLAKKCNVGRFSMLSMFDGSKDNYLIEEVSK